ncbi:MAG: hypothetical protein WCS96_02595 [Victivallales bacterium]
MVRLFKIMLWLAGIFAMLLILAVGILCCLAYSAIDERPFDVAVRIPDMNASAGVYRKLDVAGTLMSAFKGRKKGEGADKAKTVELNEREVNAMIVSALVFAEQAMPEKGGEKELRDAYFSEGAFTVLLSKKIKFKTPFGTYLNLKITFVPGIRNSHFIAEARGIKVGSLDFPVSSLKNKIDGELYNIEKSPDGQAVLDIVSELKVEKGKMTVVYSPGKLLKYMMKKGLVDGGGMIGGGSGSLSGKE